MNKFENWLEKHIGGHISVGNLTLYGDNAMHWGVSYYTKRWGYVCFRLPFRSCGGWWPLYFYLSPNATPWAATFMLRRNHRHRDWVLARVRKYRLGHNNSWAKEMGYTQDEIREILREINNII